MVQHALVRFSRLSERLSRAVRRQDFTTC